jgi:hypothetical protein
MHYKHTACTPSCICNMHYVQVQVDAHDEMTEATPGSAAAGAGGIESTPPPALRPSVWGEPEATSFKVRGPTYLTDKVRQLQMHHRDRLERARDYQLSIIACACRSRFPQTLPSCGSWPWICSRCTSQHVTSPHILSTACLSLAYAGRKPLSS